MSSIRAVPLAHVGFKDVGVSVETLRKLHDRIKQDGRLSYMEVVSTSRELLPAFGGGGRQAGRRLPDGRHQVKEVMAILKGSKSGYYPFPGIPQGHPTKLGGSVERIGADTKAMVEAGCAGVDLLAYRATEADPLELIRAARAATKKPVVVAGNVNSPQRIRDVAAAGADLFTIGTAALDGSFAPRFGLLSNQLRLILDACRGDQKPRAA